MTPKRPKILIVFAKQGTDTSTRFGGFVKRIQKAGGFAYGDVDYVALESLRFVIEDENTAQIYDPVSGVDLQNYDFVYFKSWQSMPVLASSAALYLEAMGITYADHQVRHEFSTKTSNQMAMWANHVPVPATVWGSQSVLLQYITDESTVFPLIIKAVYSEKGRDNFLAKTRKEAQQILEDASHDMMIQEFIPNDGDYRIGVYGHKARWAIYRKSGGTSHLNNTSAGGTAIHVSIDTIDIAMRKIAEAAAAACDLAVSGVDVVQNSQTGKLYVFEANQGSQIVTGAFSDTNMLAFDEGIKSMVMRRYANVQPEQKTIIGRRVVVEVVADSGISRMLAKVDTGAYQSSIDAVDVALHVDEEGREYLTYTLQSRQGDGEPMRIKTYDFGRARVQSSIGEAQMRYVVPMTLSILGKNYETRVTLADRSKNKCQILLGRTFLAGKFLVNVEYSNETRRRNEDSNPIKG